MCPSNHIHRSEIHEMMNCIRCQSDNDRPETEERDAIQSMNRSCESDQDTSDIGGFAEIAGCLDKLKSSEKQVCDPRPLKSDSFSSPCNIKAHLFF